jgi:hypothetical protein
VAQDRSINLRAELATTRDERRVRLLVELINGFVYKINTSRLRCAKRDSGVRRLA